MLLHVEDVTMAYRESAVLWDIDLDVPTGVRCAIVGPNGAGKSTLLKGVLGLEKPVAGYVRLWGKTIDEVRERIAYVPQRGAVNWDFPTTVFDVVLMGPYVHIFIARALAQESDLYIMDEPLAGVDETTERIVMDKFVALQKARKTVIAVHHDLSTLDMYFDYLVVLNRTIKASGYLKDMDKEAALALAFRPKER